ncbi:hypothetical protein DFS34DRAFT_628299 [Phlyctochytrium arcticum]|nr:hypothetical protein DFS34DRAFT_628299 [Phlyctochytrium arcticum]
MLLKGNVLGGLRYGLMLGGLTWVLENTVSSVSGHHGYMNHFMHIRFRLDITSIFFCASSSSRGGFGSSILFLAVDQVGDEHDHQDQPCRTRDTDANSPFRKRFFGSFRCSNGFGRVDWGRNGLYNRSCCALIFHKRLIKNAFIQEGV